MTNYWTSATENAVSDNYNSDSFRALLKFNSLESYLSPAANIHRARLNLTFVNWNVRPVQLEVCTLTRAWSGTPPAQSYTGLGWQRTGVSVAGQ